MSVPLPLYVPRLPTRSSATRAYGDLTPDVRRKVAPLWTLPPSTTGDTAQLRRAARRAAHVQRHSPAWLDAPYADRTTGLPATLLPEVWAGSSLRPVTGPERPPEQQRSAIRSAVAGFGEIGIRVALPGGWNEGCADDTRRLLDSLDHGVRRDLLLDLDAVRETRPDAGKEALRALDALLPLTAWHRVAVIAGGFPEDVSGIEVAGTDEAPRHELALWHEILENRPGYRELLHYGDYAPFAARSLRQEHRGGGGPPWGLLRYTTGRAYLLAKVPTRGDARAETIRAAARWITDQEDYQGPSAGAGERWLWNCARGEGSKGTGAAADWGRTAISQHLTHVVRQSAG
ncbi:beta family protein [Streptomyces griseus]|uniref:beta family protein n=1 Tax=Streptomyces griseus TaxID=1911 RepID=UPI0037B091A5